MSEERTETVPSQPEAGPASSKLANRALVTAITLPSMGLPYVGKIPDGRVFISSMTTMEEKMLAHQGSLANDRVSVLIDRCCDLGDIRADELVVGDRFYLLMKLRSVSYGNKYQFQVRCGDCRAQYRVALDIDRGLEVRTLPEDWEEPFECMLPMKQKRVELRLLRGIDERTIERMTKKKQHKEIGEADSVTFPLLLARHIVSIDGVEVREVEAIRFVENLLVRDRQALTDVIEENSPGYVPEVETVCTECGYYNTSALPMDAGFFRADSAT